MRLKTDMYTDMRNEIWNDLNQYYEKLPAVPNLAPDLKEVFVSSLCKAKLLLRIVGDLLYTSWYNGSRKHVDKRFTTELNTIYNINEVNNQLLIRLGLCPYVRISDIREHPDKSTLSITLSYVFLKHDAIVAAPLNMTIDILTKDNGYYDFESDKFITKNNRLSVRYKLYLNECDESIDLSRWNSDSASPDRIDRVHDMLYQYFYNPVTKIFISTVLLCIGSHDCGYLNFCRNCQNDFERNIRCITSITDIINKLIDDWAANKCTITYAINKQVNSIFKHADDCVDNNGVAMSTVPGVENNSWSLPNSLLDFMIFERFDNYFYYSPTSTLNYIFKNRDTKIGAIDYIKENIYKDINASQNILLDHIDVLFGLKDTFANALENPATEDIEVPVTDTAKEEEIVVDEIEESKPNRIDIVIMAKQIADSDNKKRIKRTVKIKNHSRDTSNEKSFVDHRGAPDKY